MMPAWLIDILNISGALALFIYGMKVMSEGVQRAAGGQLRKTLRNVTKHPVYGLLIGGITTALVQSSSATTVMIISFVNAGLITVYHSIGLIMGANIGTTITPWLVALGAFVFRLSSITLPLLTIAVPLYFRGNKRNQYWSQTVIGFCLLFIGLDFMTEALPALEVDAVYDFIGSFALPGFTSRILFVFIGLGLTLIVQSSSAAMTLTLALIYGEFISLELGCAMILGENIGTCITAEIAAIVGNNRARQSATIHTMFNTIGMLWMIFFIPTTISGLEQITDMITDQHQSFNLPEYSTLGLAAFHTTFNVLNTLILLPFGRILERLAIRIRPDKEKGKKAHITYLDSNVPELTSVEIQSEITRYALKVSMMVRDTHKMINAIETDDLVTRANTLINEHSKTQQHSKALSDFIVKLVKSELTDQTSDLVQRYFAIASNLERLSSLTATISHELKEKSEMRIWFTVKQRNNINQMYVLIHQALDVMELNFKQEEFDAFDVQQSSELEKQIDELRSKYRREIKGTIGNFDFNIEGTMVYFRIFTLLEKVGDKIYDITEAMAIPSDKVS